MRPLLTFVLIALATPAAGQQASFAKRWPLLLEREESGIYRILLEEEVYTTSIDPALRDVAVIDSEGHLQPAALVAHAPPGLPTTPMQDLPWFPVPPEPPRSTSQGWRVVAHTGPDARVLQVETQLLEPGTTSPEPTDVLVDASQATPGLDWIELHWEPQQQPIDARYVLETSDDLDQWRATGTPIRLIDLTNQGIRIERRRVDLVPASRSRYLRLRHAGGQRPLRITAVRGGISATTPAPKLRWLTVQGTLSAENGRTSVEFTNPGRIPVGAVQVWPQANSVQRWQLESRDRDEARWQAHGPPTVAYRLRDEHGESVSAPIQLAQPTRRRQWRLSSEGSIDPVPELHLGYTPETLVFLARGKPPYSLVAGSARSRRADAPMDELLAAQRDRHGSDWLAAEAKPGVSVQLAGRSALEPAPPPRSYTHWIMWGILLLGSALVAALALSLLRGAPPRPKA